jgi:hypothetical protein
LLRKIVEVYALRARQYSDVRPQIVHARNWDAVARLGRHDRTGPELSALVNEIKRLRALCDEAAGQLDQYISQNGKPHVAG